jgi:hypothetical protein
MPPSHFSIFMVHRGIIIMPIPGIIIGMLAGIMLAMAGIISGIWVLVMVRSF